MQGTRRDWLAMSLAFGATAFAPQRLQAAVEGCGWLNGGKLSFLVPFPAGGGYDTYARLLAAAFEKLVGGEVPVSNLTSGPVGNKALRDARPDGRTIGIVHGGDVMIRRLLEGADHPSLFTDYTLLGQVANTPTVWVVSAKSDLRTVGDLVALSAKRPVVAGVRTVSSPDFAGYATIGQLAGIPIDMVAGYKGSGEVVLSLVRGELDLAAFSAGSLRPFIEGGEVRPILQLSDRPAAEGPFLDGVPLLGGQGGWLAARAKERGLDPAAAAANADVLADALGQPRLIVAPAGLEPEKADCLRRLFMAAVADPAFAEGAAAAKQPLDPLSGDQVAKRLEPVEPALEAFLPLIRAAQERVRS